MKFIIKENKLDRAIYLHINMMMNTDEINWHHPYEYDEDGYENENPFMIEFYRGDWDGSEYSDFIFDYFMPEYYSGNSHKEQSPILEIRDENITRELSGFFGNRWIPVFKEWFKDNFDLPVKTISFWYDN